MSMQVEELTQHGECNQVKFQTKFRRQTVDRRQKSTDTWKELYLLETQKFRNA